MGRRSYSALASSIEISGTFVGPGGGGGGVPLSLSVFPHPHRAVVADNRVRIDLMQNMFSRIWQQSRWAQGQAATPPYTKTKASRRFRILRSRACGGHCRLRPLLFVTHLMEEFNWTMKVGGQEHLGAFSDRRWGSVGRVAQVLRIPSLLGRQSSLQATGNFYAGCWVPDPSPVCMCSAGPIAFEGLLAPSLFGQGNAGSRNRLSGETECLYIDYGRKGDREGNPAGTFHLTLLLRNTWSDTR